MLRLLELSRHTFRVYPVKVSALDREAAGFKDFILIVKAAQAAEDRDMAEGHWLRSQP